MKWDKLKNHPTNFILFLSISLTSVALLSAGYFYNSNELKHQKLTGIKLGASVCASRVGQSYFSFKNGNTLSAKLEDRFLNQTDECFMRLDEKIKTVSLPIISSLSTEYYDLFINFKNMVRNADSKDFKLSQNYNEIEKLKYEINVKLSKAMKSVRSKRSAFKFMFMILASMLILSCCFFLLSWSRFTKKLARIEEEAQMLMHDYDGNEIKVERFMEKVLTFFNLSATQELFVDYHQHVLSNTNGISQNKHKALGDNSRDNEFKIKVFQDEIEFNDEPIEVDLSPLEKFESEEINLELEKEVFDAQEVSVANHLSKMDSADELKAIVKEASAVNERVELDEETLVLSTAELQPKVMAVEEGVVFKDFVSKVTRAFLRNNSNSSLSWEFSSDHKEFSFTKDHEELEHIIHSLLSRVHKGFEESETQRSSRVVGVETKTLFKDLQITFTCKGILFNTAELEYLNTMDSSLKKMIDISFIMLQKLILNLNGEIEIQNTFNLEGEQEAIIRLFLPLSVTSITPTAKKESSGLKRLIKGSKKQILKSLNKENFV